MVDTKIKYIDVDKLKAAINDKVTRNKMFVLNLIDSLQQEQMEADLEKELERYVKENCPYYNRMKPIEKYKEKFIELLKEAEEELGDELTITVSSRFVSTDLTNANSYPAPKKKGYRFKLETGDKYVL